jgi:hypothetical protein
MTENQRKKLHEILDRVWNCGHSMELIDNDLTIEEILQALSLPNVVGQSEQLVCSCQGCGEEKKIEYCEKCYAENLHNIAN